MSIYKKRINNIDKMYDTEYIMSNNRGVYMNQTVLGENTSPYHGLFIKQSEKGDKVYLSKVIEKIKINSKLYSVTDINTNEEIFGGKEYIETFDRYPFPKIKYSIDDLVKYEKKYIFDIHDNVLCISYEVENLTKNSANFKVLPLITDRDIFTSKRESMIKFNTVSLNDMAKVTLSITQNKYLYLKSNNSKFKEKPHYINGVKYILKEDSGKEQLLIDDLYVPGYFEFNVKGNSTFSVQIYIACENVDIKEEKYKLSKLCQNQEEKNKLITLGINEEFYELRRLAISASELNYIDSENKKFVLLNGIPNRQGKANYLKSIIKSIEGNYLLLGKNKEAYKILESLKYSIEIGKGKYSSLEYYEILFYYIEALNKYMNLESTSDKEKENIINYIENSVNNVLNLEDENKILDSYNVVTIDDKQFLLVNIYWYDVLKIALNITKDQEFSNKLYNITENLKSRLVDIFFDEQEKVLKYEVKEKPYANSDMILAMDLTYPLIHDTVAMKVIDTAFKQLYTPYGLRKFSINSGRNDGYVYPYLMASFVHANLRQNGVTRATQKISYNLVKELLLELNNKTIGTVKYKYDEKTREAYGMTIDSLTNAELVRLYNMLI